MRYLPPTYSGCLRTRKLEPIDRRRVEAKYLLGEKQQEDTPEDYLTCLDRYLPRGSNQLLGTWYCVLWIAGAADGDEHGDGHGR